MTETLARRAERKTRQRAANRCAIVEAARRVASREGSHELSLRAVAAEAGYAPASVYEYFHNRAELVLALASEELGHATRLLKEPLDGSQAAEVLFTFLKGCAALPEAAGVFEREEISGDAERIFNGKLIAALTVFSEALGRAPLKSREEQGDVVLMAASILGLASLARAGRLKVLGLDQAELLARLETRFGSGSR
jgi:AcrR family transcriptional regulator